MAKWKCLAAVLTASLGSAACSGVSSSDGSGSDSGEPIRVAYINILQGAGSVDGGDRGIKLATDEINASGGIMGRKVEVKSYNMDINPASSVTATNLALKDDADVIMGYVVSAGLKAAAPTIARSGALVMHRTIAKITSPSSLKTDNTFRISPTSQQMAAAGFNYLTQKQGVKKLMNIHAADAASTEGAAELKGLSNKANVSYAERSVPPTATDLTEAVLAARDADGVWEWGNSTTDSLFLRQMQQNGVQKPSVGINTLSAAVSSGSIPASLLTDKTANVAFCASDSLTTPAAEKYRAAFQKAYNTAITEAYGPEYYDAMYLYKAAVEKAKSTDSTQVGETLNGIQYDGVCGSYEADQHRNLRQSVEVVNYPNGKGSIAATFSELPTDF